MTLKDLRPILRGNNIKLSLNQSRQSQFDFGSIDDVPEEFDNKIVYHIFHCYSYEPVKNWKNDTIGLLIFLWDACGKEKDK